jgi:hypothetical protein
MRQPTGANNMNKSETREVQKLNAILKMPHEQRPVGIDYLARSFSFLVRASRTTKSRNEILTAAAAVPAVVQHAEFIV